MREIWQVQIVLLNTGGITVHVQYLEFTNSKCKSPHECQCVNLSYSNALGEQVFNIFTNLMSYENKQYNAVM